MIFKLSCCHLFSALCGNGAKKLLEDGEALLEQMVQCMGNSYPHSVRIEAFKLAQCLAVRILSHIRTSLFC